MTLITTVLSESSCIYQIFCFIYFYIILPESSSEKSSSHFIFFICQSFFAWFDISMTVIFVVYALKRSTMAREIGQQRLIWVSQGIPLSYHIGLTPKRNLSYVIVEKETPHWIVIRKTSSWKLHKLQFLVTAKNNYN